MPRGHNHPLSCVCNFCRALAAQEEKESIKKTPRSDQWWKKKMPKRKRAAPRRRAGPTQKQDKYSQYFTISMPTEPAAAEAAWSEARRVPPTPAQFTAGSGKSTVLEFDRIEWVFDGPIPQEIETPISLVGGACQFGLLYRPWEAAYGIDGRHLLTDTSVFWLHHEDYIHNLPAAQTASSSSFDSHTNGADILQDRNGFGRIWPLVEVYPFYSYYDRYATPCWEATSEMDVQLRIWYRYTQIPLLEYIGLTSQMTQGAVR